MAVIRREETGDGPTHRFAENRVRTNATLALHQSEITNDALAFRVLAGRRADCLIVCDPCGLIADHATLGEVRGGQARECSGRQDIGRHRCGLYLDDANIGYFVEQGCRALCRP